MNKAFALKALHTIVAALLGFTPSLGRGEMIAHGHSFLAQVTHMAGRQEHWLESGITRSPHKLRYLHHGRPPASSSHRILRTWQVHLAWAGRAGCRPRAPIGPRQYISHGIWQGSRALGKHRSLCKNHQPQTRGPPPG